jgi:hypothetical protein
MLSISGLCLPWPDMRTFIRTRRSLFAGRHGPPASLIWHQMTSEDRDILSRLLTGAARSTHCRPPGCRAASALAGRSNRARRRRHHSVRRVRPGWVRPDVGIPCTKRSTGRRRQLCRTSSTDLALTSPATPSPGCGCRLGDGKGSRIGGGRNWSRISFSTGCGREQESIAFDDVVKLPEERGCFFVGGVKFTTRRWGR